MRPRHGFGTAPEGTISHPFRGFAEVGSNEQPRGEDGALGVPVDEVCNVVAERTVQPRLGSHGVRLDAMVHTKSAVYDVEMQTIARRGIGRRMRYYQGAMDTAMLPPGADYTRLADSYIVFICLQDEFGAGCPVYTFDMACAC